MKRHTGFQGSRETEKGMTGQNGEPTLEIILARCLAVILGAAFSFNGSVAAAGYCDDPSAGLRACDAVNNNCPVSADWSSWSDVHREGDYSSWYEGNDYLENLDALDANDVMEILPLGEVWQPSDYFPGFWPPTDPIEQIAVKLTAGVSDGPYAERPDVLFMAGMHADEWLGPEVLMHYLDRLVKEGNDADPSGTADDLLASYEIWVVPYVSPQTRVYDDDWYEGDPALGLGRRKSIALPPGFWCSSDWTDVAHHGNCGSETGWVSEWEGVNVARGFPYDWGYNAANNARYDRAERLGDAGRAMAPELDTSRNTTNLPCADAYPDHPNFVELDPTTGDGACFIQPAFTGATQNEARNACMVYNILHFSENIDDLGIYHHSCLDVAPDGAVFRTVLAECGSFGDSFNDAAGTFYDDSPAVDSFEKCANGIRFDCFEDADCQSLQANGVLPERWGAGGEAICRPIPYAVGTAGGLAAWPQDASGNDVIPGYCATNRQTTCCDGDFAGLHPFDVPEARMLRDLVSNVPFVAAMDLHSFRGETTYVERGIDADDADNGDDVIVEATNVFNDAAAPRWLAVPGFASQPQFVQAWYENGYGSGLGQALSWLSRQSDTITTFENGTLRSISAFGMELPPRTSAGDYGANAEYVTCNASHATGKYPRAQQMVSQTADGFAAMADYLLRQASRPGLGSDRNGVALAHAQNTADIALVGAQIHDTAGKGVLWSRYDDIAGDPEAEITIPAGTWELSLDLRHRCDGTGCPGAPGPGIISPLPALAEIEVQRMNSAGTFASVKSHQAIGQLWPNGDPVRLTRAYGFEAGETYLVETRFMNVVGFGVGYQDNNTANDTRRFKVRAVSCLDGADRPNGFSGDGYCRGRIEGDEEQFRCDEELESCAECWLDGETGELSTCEDLYGAGAFCVGGICDTEDVCWSAAILDPFEGAEPREIQGTFNEVTRFEATLKTTASSYIISPDPAQDTDRINYFYNMPGMSIPGRELQLAVWPICAADGADVEAGALEYRAFVPASGFSFSAISPIVDWTVPPSGTVASSEPYSLTDYQVEQIRNGRPVVVEVRSVADAAGIYPQAVYGVSIGILGGGTLPEIDIELGSVLVPPWTPVMLSAERGAVATIVPDSGRVAAGDTLVVKLSGADAAALVQSTRVVVTDAFGDPVGQVLKSGTAITVPLSSLDSADGPFDVHVQSATAPLSGMIYHCPANTPDCLAFDPARDACGGASCGNDSVCCRGANEYAECIDIASDPDNCGACGWPCGPNEACLDGVCAVVTSLDCEGTTCPSGLACCEDATGMPSCAERTSDSENCGWCGHACASSKRCQLGLCVPRWGEKCSASCASGKTCCYSLLGGTQCVDTATSALNCGKCGNACGFGETCAAGKCEPWLSVFNPCWGGQANCGAPGWIDCKNLLTDGANCGACRLSCPSGACSAGKCVASGEAGIPDDCGGPGGAP